MYDPATTPSHIGQLLSAVDRPGDFHATGTVEAPTPAITVDRLRLSFPVPDSQARALVELAEPAPYGRGGETLVDAAVRRVWQIAAPRVAIGARWQRTLDAIVADATHGLGVSDSVHAKLYKLLVYDAGCFFVPHRDTEKVDGMFATLVVVLPAAHEGGELVVRHRDRVVRLDLPRDDPAGIAWCAFYTDCLHEILPVTAGNRICLVYNLVRDGGCLSAPDRTDAVDAIAAALRACATGGEGWPVKLAFALEHRYTPKSLAFAGLKNGDRAAAAALVEAARRAGCEVHLAMIAITETGTAEENDDRGRRHRRYDDDHIEVVEVLDRSVAAEDWRAPDDGRPPFGAIPVEEGEVWPPDAIAEEKPDEQHYHEATGNEGAEFQRTYRRAALVDGERREVATAAAEALADRALPRWAGAAEVEGVLGALWQLDAAAAAERFATRAVATCTAERLLQVALSLARTARARPGWDTLRRAAVAHVLRDAGPAPTPPADLARPASWSCSCPDCGHFRAFLASPTEASWSLKANEHARRHVEAVIERHRIEVDRSTLRTNPRTLVCTKNARRYEDAVSRRARALEVLALLDPLDGVR